MEGSIAPTSEANNGVKKDDFLLRLLSQVLEEHRDGKRSLPNYSCGELRREIDKCLGRQGER